MQGTSEFANGQGERFEATRWSVALAAGQQAAAPESARHALAQLCGIRNCANCCAS